MELKGLGVEELADKAINKILFYPQIFVNSNTPELSFFQLHDYFEISHDF